MCASRGKRYRLGSWKQLRRQDDDDSDERQSKDRAFIHRGENVSGHRVKPAGMQRMTSGNPPRRKVRTTHGTMALDCLDGVLRARRVEATNSWQERAQKHLVRAHERNEDVAHLVTLYAPPGSARRSRWSTCSSSARNRSNVASYAARCAQITSSTGIFDGRINTRTSSRRRRFSRLRSTALCRCRGTTMPTRSCA